MSHIHTHFTGQSKSCCELDALNQGCIVSPRHSGCKDFALPSQTLSGCSAQFRRKWWVVMNVSGTEKVDLDLNPEG